MFLYKVIFGVLALLALNAQVLARPQGLLGSQVGDSNASTNDDDVVDSENLIYAISDDAAADEADSTSNNEHDVTSRNEYGYRIYSTSGNKRDNTGEHANYDRSDKFSYNFHKETHGNNGFATIEEEFVPLSQGRLEKGAYHNKRLFIF